MSEKLKSQIKALAIINAILFISIVFAAQGIMDNLSLQNRWISGKLTYLSDWSDPTNFSKGVWIKITLEHPEKANIIYLYIVVKLPRGEVASFTFEGFKNTTAKYHNYTAEFYDMNRDYYVSSGDEIHIWGDTLKNAIVLIRIITYKGQLQVKV